jgi:predicted dienelactone hydrolase
MYPAYLLISILFIYTLKDKSVLTGNLGFKILKVFTLCLLLTPAWLLPYILPVFELPTPSGAYSVGARSLHLITDKNEDITLEANDKRELMIKVWYPAVLSGEAKDTYLDNGERWGFTKKYGLPNSTLNYLDYIKTNSYKSPKVQEGKFPVLVFSPGIYSNATGYYAILEELVSQGYIVLNVNHTYESMGSLFPDGQVKYYDKAYDQKHNNQKNREMIWHATQNFNRASTAKEEYEAIHIAVQDYVAADVNKRWARDLSLVIDAMAEWDSSSFLAGHMATNAIGSVGHSQGGGAAAQVLLDDTRVKAAINIDGVHWGDMIDYSMSKPFMLLSSEWDEYHPNFNKHIYARQSSADFYEVMLKNAGHASFLDIPLMIRIPMLNESGTIDPNTAHKATAAIITRFFDKYIKNKKVAIKQVSEEYSEIEILKRSN